MLELLFVIVRALGYAAALSGAGAVLATATVFRFVPASSAQVTLVRISGAVLAICASGTAAIYVLRLGAAFDPDTLGAVFLSPVGAALAMQCLGGIWLLCLGHRGVAVPGAMIALLAFGVTGHSASRGLSTAATVIAHVSAASWWLGGLWLLLLASRRVEIETFARMLRRFSAMATAVVALLIVGALLTAAQLLEFQFDGGRGYERALLAKVGLTLVLLAMAGTNRWVFSPRMLSQASSRVWLRSSVLAEIAAIAIVLSVTAWLTTRHSPHDADHAQAAVEMRGIAILDPWAPAMPPGVDTGAGYLVIENRNALDDQLLSASSAWAEHLTLHASTIDQGLSRMREAESLAIPAGKRLVLAPGAYHLMFSGLYAPFAAGDDIPIRLEFARAGTVDVTLKVRPLDGTPVHTH